MRVFSSWLLHNPGLKPGRHSWPYATMAATLLALALPAQAAITASAGYIYSTLAVGNTTQSCVAAGPGGTFVGVGPGFTANAQSVVQVSESGVVRTLATGFNSISDCAYDAATDVLYVSDNADAGDLPGALTGDTVFVLPNASTATGLTAVGHELLPQNSVPAAAGVAINSAGDVFVGNATGPAAGTVQRLTPSQSTFASPFDYTAGLAFDPNNGTLFVSETTSSFNAKITRYSAAGAFISTIAGPSSAFGSYDLAFTHDGFLLSTGSANITAFNSVGAQSTFASGFSFPTGISTNAFTGRVEILDSFSGSANDSSVHRFTPVAKLVPGGTKAASECIEEIYGVELVAARPGQTPRNAICVDGAACDADGLVNDQCVFPVGVCFDVSDPRFPSCPSNDVSEVTVTAKPTSAGLTAFAGQIQTALPITSPACFFSDGISVPVKVTTHGKKSGKGTMKVKAATAAGKDTDTVRLVCQPAP